MNIPLKKKGNNHIVFNKSKIKERSYLKKLLSLKTENFSFLDFGMCKDKKDFYIRINIYDKEGKPVIISYKLKMKEFNEEFYIEKIKKLNKNEEIACDIAFI